MSQFIDTSKYTYIHAFDKHGLLLLYNKNIACSTTTIKTHNGSEFIEATFNASTQSAIHVITVYRSHSTSRSMFLRTIKELISEAPLTCPILILGDFNIDLYMNKTKDNNSQQLIQIMSEHNFKQQLSTPTTKSNSLIDHIWTNIPSQATKYGVTDAYWLDYYKSIYCAFKLPNTMPNYTCNKKKSFFI